MLTQLALAPVMVLLIFLLAFDRYTKEPLWLMVLFYVYGAFSVVPVMAYCSYLAQTGLKEYMPYFYTAFLSSAIPEEFIKAVFIYFLINKNKFINEPFDFIVYPCIFALGFASAENIVYVYHPFLGGISTAVTRAVFSVPGHFLFAVSMGFYFAGGGCFNYCRKNIFKAFFMTRLLHGAYNFIIAFMGEMYLFVFIPFIFWLWKRGLKHMLYMQIKYSVNIS